MGKNSPSRKSDPKDAPIASTSGTHPESSGTGPSAVSRTGGFETPVRGTSGHPTVSGLEAASPHRLDTARESDSTTSFSTATIPKFNDQDVTEMEEDPFDEETTPTGGAQQASSQVSPYGSPELVRFIQFLENRCEALRCEHRPLPQNRNFGLAKYHAATRSIPGPKSIRTERLTRLNNWFYDDFHRDIGDAPPVHFKELERVVIRTEEESILALRSLLQPANKVLGVYMFGFDSEHVSNLGVLQYDKWEDKHKFLKVAPTHPDFNGPFARYIQMSSARGQVFIWDLSAFSGPPPGLHQLLTTHFPDVYLAVHDVSQDAIAYYRNYGRTLRTWEQHRATANPPNDYNMFKVNIVDTKAWGEILQMTGRSKYKSNRLSDHAHLLLGIPPPSVTGTGTYWNKILAKRDYEYMINDAITTLDLLLVWIHLRYIHFRGQHLGPAPVAKEHFEAEECKLVPGAPKALIVHVTHLPPADQMDAALRINVEHRMRIIDEYNQLKKKKRSRRFRGEGAETPSDDDWDPADEWDLPEDYNTFDYLDKILGSTQSSVPPNSATSAQMTRPPAQAGVTSSAAPVLKSKPTSSADQSSLDQLTPAAASGTAKQQAKDNAKTQFDAPLFLPPPQPYVRPTSTVDPGHIYLQTPAVVSTAPTAVAPPTPNAQPLMPLKPTLQTTSFPPTELLFAKLDLESPLPTKTYMLPPRTADEEQNRLTAESLLRFTASAVNSVMTPQLAELFTSCLSTGRIKRMLDQMRSDGEKLVGEMGRALHSAYLKDSDPTLQTPPLPNLDRLPNADVVIAIPIRQVYLPFSFRFISHHECTPVTIQTVNRMRPFITSISMVMEIPPEMAHEFNPAVCPKRIRRADREDTTFKDDVLAHIYRESSQSYIELDMSCMYVVFHRLEEYYQRYATAYSLIENYDIAHPCFKSFLVESFYAFYSTTRSSMLAYAMTLQVFRLAQFPGYVHIHASIAKIFEGYGVDKGQTPGLDKHDEMQRHLLTTTGRLPDLRTAEYSTRNSRRALFVLAANKHPKRKSTTAQATDAAPEPATPIVTPWEETVRRTASDTLAGRNTTNEPDQWLLGEPAKKKRQHRGRRNLEKEEERKALRDELKKRKELERRISDPTVPTTQTQVDANRALGTERGRERTRGPPSFRRMKSFHQVSGTAPKTDPAPTTRILPPCGKGRGTASRTQSIAPPQEPGGRFKQRPRHQSWAPYTTKSRGPRLDMVQDRHSRDVPMDQTRPPINQRAQYTVTPVAPSQQPQAPVQGQSNVSVFQQPAVTSATLAQNASILQTLQEQNFLLKGFLSIPVQVPTGSQPPTTSVQPTTLPSQAVARTPQHMQNIEAWIALLQQIKQNAEQEMQKS